MLNFFIDTDGVLHKSDGTKTRATAEELQLWEALAHPTAKAEMLAAEDVGCELIWDMEQQRTVETLPSPPGKKAGFPTTVTSMVAEGRRGEAPGFRLRQQRNPFFDTAVGSACFFLGWLLSSSL